MVLILTLRLKVVSKLVCYTSDQIPHVWEMVKDPINRAVEKGSEYTLQEIRQGLCRAKMQLWTSQNDGIEAALVTTIQNNDKLRYCLLLAAGGTNVDEWCQWLPEVEKWAKELGCEEMQIYGRIGWSRKIGYNVHYTKMTRQLCENSAIQ